jgi:hypothetical protein
MPFIPPVCQGQTLWVIVLMTVVETTTVERAVAWEMLGRGLCVEEEFIGELLTVTMGALVVLRVIVRVVETTVVTVFALGVTVATAVYVARAFVSVFVCVLNIVVVLHTEMVFAGGAGQALVHAGQMTLLAMPFNQDGGLRLRASGATVTEEGKAMVVVSVTDKRGGSRLLKERGTVS